MGIGRKIKILFTAAIITLAVHAPACAASFDALFVGVAHYRYSGSAGFADLRAAPNDIALLKSVLERRGLKSNATTLLGPQATRANILAALDEYAEGRRGKPGDMLLFYFTGHGAQLQDASGDQKTYLNSTILPFDAREPAAVERGEPGDILDTELRERLTATAARGINVVTIFDSCNAGSATRSLSPMAIAKGAPAARIAVPPPRIAIPAAPPAGGDVGPGFLVHLAAAADGTRAWEDQQGDGRIASDFTVALSAAIEALPRAATFQDLLDCARVTLEQRGRRQQPVAEGDLFQGFALRESGRYAIFRASARSDGDLDVDAGTLAGLVPHSELALFGDASSAASPRALPVGAAHILSGTPFAAVAHPKAAVATGTVFYAREATRAFAGNRLKLSIGGAARRQGGQVRSLLARFDFIEQSPPADAFYGLDFVGEHAVLTAADGSEVLRRKRRDVRGLGEALASLARYHALLALGSGGPQLGLDLGLVAEDCAGRSLDAIERRDGEARLHLGQRVRIAVGNESDRPLFTYVLHLGSDHSVALIDPPPGPGGDPPLDPGQCYRAPREIRAADAGRGYLLLIAADRPLPGLRALQQDRLRDIASNDPLERLLLSAETGRRAPAETDLGVWGAKIVSFTVAGNGGT